MGEEGPGLRSGNERFGEPSTRKEAGFQAPSRYPDMALIHVLRGIQTCPSAFLMVDEHYRQEPPQTPDWKELVQVRISKHGCHGHVCEPTHNRSIIRRCLRMSNNIPLLRPSSVAETVARPCPLISPQEKGSELCQSPPYHEFNPVQRLLLTGS